MLNNHDSLEALWVVTVQNAYQERVYLSIVVTKVQLRALGLVEVDVV